VGERAGAARALALGQGLYWAATGAWPLVHMPSFEAVTGRKRERWLVRTVGVLVLAVGATLAAAARSRRITPEIRLLGAACAGGLGAVDAWYGGVRRRISPIYLADAALEAALVAGWLSCPRSARQDGRGAAESGGPRGAGGEGAR
jgi:hypothetical protein